MRTAHRAAVLVWLSAALGSASCAGGAGPQPEDTIAAYRRALRDDDPRAAYALLATRARGAHSADEFERSWRQGVEERKEQERALGGSMSVTLQARSAPGGDDIELRRDGGFWRLSEVPVPGQPARTPEEAVRALVRAVERNDLRAFMRLLTSPAAQDLRARIRERLERLKAALDQPILAEGDRATFQYDPRFRIELRREGDEWRIADFD